VCGREIPVVTLPPEHLKGYGWQPWQLWSTIERCGHRVEGIPVPYTDGCWCLIVVEGEAEKNLNTLVAEILEAARERRS
jgi:hypothetical protein